VQDFGYAEWAPCNANNTGNSQTDCPAGSFQLTGSQAPYTGARLWQFANGSVTKGALNSANTVQTSNVDATHGDSGSAFLFGLNSPTDYRALGLVCAVMPTSNIGSRLTGETASFFSSNSHFPSDTM
jgi:hypothetical protein